MIFGDNGRSAISWDTYEGLMVQIGVLSYTAMLLASLLVSSTIMWAVMWAISRFSAAGMDPLNAPIVVPESAPRSLHLFNKVNTVFFGVLTYIMSLRWAELFLRFAARHLVGVTIASLIAVGGYYAAVRLSLDYVYCVPDDRATSHFKCTPEEEDRPVTVDVFDRVIDSGLYG